MHPFSSSDGLQYIFATDAGCSTDHNVRLPQHAPVQQQAELEHTVALVPVCVVLLLHLWIWCSSRDLWLQILYNSKARFWVVWVILELRSQKLVIKFYGIFFYQINISTAPLQGTGSLLEMLVGFCIPMNSRRICMKETMAWNILTISCFCVVEESYQTFILDTPQVWSIIDLCS